jgi:hypothetical protein
MLASKFRLIRPPLPPSRKSSERDYLGGFG